MFTVQMFAIDVCDYPMYVKGTIYSGLVSHNPLCNVKTLPTEISLNENSGHQCVFVFNFPW